MSAEESAKKMLDQVDENAVAAVQSRDQVAATAAVAQAVAGLAWAVLALVRDQSRRQRPTP